MHCHSDYILMSKPSIIPKTTRAQALKEAALKKKQEEKMSKCSDVANQVISIMFTL